MELSSNDRTYTFKRKGVVVGSYSTAIEFAESQAQQLVFDNLKTQCSECGWEPFHIVTKDRQLLRIQCSCHQQKSPA